MTQEEKQLLLKDLCARLPYGVKVWYPNGSGAISTVKGIVDGVCYFNENPKYGNFCRIETVKLYLRPMSSMTDEEKKELAKEQKKDEDLFLYIIKKSQEGNDSLLGTAIPHYAEDWANKNYFDYRGLIEKGLALEANERMYKTE